MSTIADVFPHDDAEARFVVAMSMARNDLRHAMQQAGEANTADAPEFYYWVRLAMGHLFEGIDALNRWRQHTPEVRAFLKRLPAAARRDLAAASGTLQTVGGGAVEQTRHRTFHYPRPNPKYDPDSDTELFEVLKSLGGEPATVAARAGDPRDLRLSFADLAALMLAMSRHAGDEDQPELRRQVKATLDGAGAFVRFAEAALGLFLDQRGERGELEAR
jgi:hypothetical protein